MSRNRGSQSPSDRGGAPSPELEQVLCDLRSPDDWTRASAVRALCPCRRKDWGIPVYRYVHALRDDPSPLVRGAVQHDLTENRWTENWEARLIQKRRSRRAKVTLALKAMALGDLCERLRVETGLPLMVEGRIAAEKVSLFCGQSPVRNVMRQLSRALGYTWEWRGKKDAGHFQLVRDPQAPNLENADSDARRVRGRVLRSRASLSLSPSGDVRSRGTTTDGVAPQVTVTSADLLEALHRASGLPLIAAGTARRVTVETAAFTARPLSGLFRQVAEATGMQWRFSDGEWLQFRQRDTEAQE